MPCESGDGPRILAIPGMLFAAGHAKNDIPAVLNAYAAEHGIDIRYGRDLGIDLKLLRAAGERIEEALAGGSNGVARHDTLLMVVGRGASDPDHNGNVAKVCRLLWEGMGFGWAETAYSGLTFPVVEPALEHAAKLGYRRIVVFPYFLFTGRLVKRIYAHTDQVAARHPDIEFLKAPYLNDHPLVLGCVRRAGAGDPRRHQQHELPAVQVSRAAPGVRGRGRRPADEPPPPRRGRRHGCR